jgi:hypothetical protein
MLLIAAMMEARRDPLAVTNGFFAAKRSIFFFGRRWIIPFALLGLIATIAGFVKKSATTGRRSQRDTGDVNNV